MLIEERDKEDKTVKLKKTALDGTILEYFDVEKLKELETKQEILAALGLKINDLTVLNGINLNFPGKQED